MRLERLFSRTHLWPVCARDDGGRRKLLEYQVNVERGRQLAAVPTEVLSVVEQRLTQGQWQTVTS